MRVVFVYIRVQVLFIVAAAADVKEFPLKRVHRVVNDVIHSFNVKYGNISFDDHTIPFRCSAPATSPSRSGGDGSSRGGGGGGEETSSEQSGGENLSFHMMFHVFNYIFIIL